MTAVPEENAPALTTERVMGIETEFGVVHADLEDRARSGSGSAILLSHLVVGAYALLDPLEGERGRRVRWGHRGQAPAPGGGGFRVPRAPAPPRPPPREVPGAPVARGREDLPPGRPGAAPGRGEAQVLAWAAQRSIGNAV